MHFEIPWYSREPCSSMTNISPFRDLPLSDIVRFLGVVNGHDVEVDKPSQRVLVHGLNIRQISDREEQDG